MPDNKNYHFKPLNKLAGWVCGLMVVQLAATLIFVGLLIAGHVLGIPTSPFTAPLDILDVITNLSQRVDLAIIAVSASSALVWIYGAARNTRALRPQLGFSPAAAIIWFFVPIAFLFKPYQSMCRVWETAAGPRDGVYSGKAGPVALWWGLLLLSVVFYALSWNVTDPVLYACMAIPSAAFGAAATLAFMKIVRDVTRMQTQGHDRLAEHF